MANKWPEPKVISLIFICSVYCQNPQTIHYMMFFALVKQHIFDTLFSSMNHIVLPILKHLSPTITWPWKMPDVCIICHGCVYPLI